MALAITVIRTEGTTEEIPIGENAIIDKDLIRNKDTVANVIIPEGVTTIGIRAFEDCTSLAAISLPRGLTSIGNVAFSNCRSLASITLPAGLTGIGAEAFIDCTSLASITLPEGVTTIGEQAFIGCTSLVLITLREGLTTIGWRAFNGCSSLASIAIPAGVTEIKFGTFEGCTSLASVTLSEEMTEIGEHAFRDCTSLVSISIPEGMREIEENAFSGCSSLTSISIPETVTELGNGVFSECGFFYMEMPARYKHRLTTESEDYQNGVIFDSFPDEPEIITLSNHPSLLLVKLTSPVPGEAEYIAGTRLVQLKNRIDQVRRGARAIEAAPTPVSNTFPMWFVTDTIIRSPDLPMTSQLRKYYKQVSLTLQRARIPAIVVQIILHYLFDEEPSRQYFDWTKPAPLALMNE